MTGKYPYHYAWRNNELRARLWNKRCRIVVTGRRNSAWIEFEDGFQMVTSRRALRRLDQET